MLCGIYAPTDHKSFNADPSISAEDKLAIAANSLIGVRDNKYGDSFRLSLPFTKGAFIAAPKEPCTEADLYMLAFSIDVGDADLYGNGIGTRFMKAAVRYAIEKPDKPLRFVTGWARLGLVNTAVRVFGQENVSVTQNGQRYGWQSDAPLEQVLEDFPATPGEKYLVYGIDAAIDPVQAMEWEMPVPVEAIGASEQ